MKVLVAHYMDGHPRYVALIEDSVDDVEAGNEFLKSIPISQRLPHFLDFAYFNEEGRPANNVGVWRYLVSQNKDDDWVIIRDSDR